MYCVGAKAGVFRNTWCEPVGLAGATIRGANVRVLVNEAGCVVDLVVDDNVEVLLGVVLRDVGVGEFLVGHGSRCAWVEELVEVCDGGLWVEEEWLRLLLVIRKMGRDSRVELREEHCSRE